MLDDPGFDCGRGKRFLSAQNAQTSCAAQAMGAWGDLVRAQQQGHELVYTPPSSAEIKCLNEADGTTLPFSYMSVGSPYNWPRRPRG